MHNQAKGLLNYSHNSIKTESTEIGICSQP